MPAKYFVDTNVFVYLLDQSASEKSEVARELIGRLLDEGTGVISAQVPNEFFAVALRKFKTVMAVPDAQAFLRTVFSGFSLTPLPGGHGAGSGIVRPA